MKIIKEDQNLMVIKDRNIIAFLIGIFFVLGGFLVILKPDFFTSNRPPMWSGFVTILIGLFIIFTAKITTINLDKTKGKIVFKWKNLINEKSNEYDISLIKQIELQQMYTSSGRGGEGGYSYRLVFVLDNGEEIQLNPSGSSIIRVMGRQIIPEKEIGNRIANFLNISFQERRPPTVSETLSVVESTIQKEIEKHKKE